MLTRETKGCVLSTLKAAELVPLSLGCQRPLALMIVLISPALPFNSFSKALVLPHSATCRIPSEATVPSSHTRRFLEWEEPMMSEK